MTSPTTLREQARRLREAARAVRETGAGLDEHVRSLLENYPLPSPQLWQGTYAVRYRDDLLWAQEELRRVGTDADQFADECEAEARTRDREAARLESEVSTGAY